MIASFLWAAQGFGPAQFFCCLKSSEQKGGPESRSQPICVEFPLRLNRPSSRLYMDVSPTDAWARADPSWR